MADNAPTAEPVQISAIMRDTTKGPIWMQVVAFLWFVSTFAVFPGNAYFLYPLSAIFMVTLYFERDRIMPIVVRCWWIFPMPILAILSFTWSDYPSASMRFGLFFLLSPLILIILSAILTERQILRALFFCALAGTGLAITELGAIMSTQTSAYLGQKNFYAMKMMIGMIAGFAMAMNKNENSILRLLGLALIPIDLFLVLAADSATSMVLSFLALFLLIFAQIFWVSSRGVQGLRAFVAVFSVFVVSAGALVALGALSGALIGDGLSAVGKDTTFTGRTALWEQAERTSADNPILGVGVGAFWQYDVGAAQTLALNDNREAGTALGFHNTYWETRVHLGFVGLFFLLLSFAMIIWKSTKSFLMEATLERAAFFVAVLITMSMTFTESFLFGYFQPSIYIFQLAGITAVASAYRKKRVILNLIPESDDEELVAAPA
ncbi:MAG: O-antigen ligase family protein [Henriciella sp.]